MKRKRTTILIICLALVVVIGGNNSIQAKKDVNPEDRIEDAAEVLEDLSEQRDNESMAKILKRAKGVVIFPEVVKGGFMLGARYGKGLLLKYDETTDTWYGPHFITMKGLSYGLQIGVQSTNLVLIITNKEGLERFKQDTLTLGGDLSVAAGPTGRSTGAGTDITLKASIYSYSINKGAFMGFSVEGAGVSQDKEANKIYWGQEITPEQIFNKRAYGSEIADLIDTIEKITATTK